MKIIDLKNLYPNNYRNSEIYNISDDVFNVLEDFRRTDEALAKKRKRNKDIYSLNVEDGIESNISIKVETPDEIVEKKWLISELHKAIDTLPEKQARRITKHYLMGISKVEIAHTEGLSEGAIHHSIDLGLKELKKYFEKNCIK